MVDTPGTCSDIISKLVVKRTQMTISELIPFFDFTELIKFYGLNRASKAVLTPNDSKCLRFDVLFGRWSIGSRPAAPSWREDLAAVLAETQSFGQVIKKMRSYMSLVPHTKF